MDIGCTSLSRIVIWEWVRNRYNIKMRVGLAMIFSSVLYNNDLELSKPMNR